MNIYNLSRLLLQMYDDSERSGIDDRAMSTQKWERKIKALDQEIRQIQEHIQKLEDADPISMAEDLLEMYENSESSVISEFSGDLDKDYADLAKTIDHYKRRIAQAKGEDNA